MPSTPRSIPVVTDLAASASDQPKSVTLYCPSCEGLDGSAYDTLALLPIHDANERLLAELRNGVPIDSQVFAGVFALDPFRRHVDILKALEAAGCHGVVNFPSVTAIDGEMRVSLEDFGYGVTAEINLLRTAVAKGFGALAVVDSFGMAQDAVTIGVSGLIAARHANDAMLAELSELAHETSLGLFRLPDAVGGT
ncbi:phosphoenolpyruvate hydrolase family protein (plasmid) [Sinorhizobium garamanticum]|uniref:Phosphoenolpyruvate hydrolase family protein n=1 Tax=Sinorhizobium garamanticum TaxID=680247 RepID=A0ABY8DLA6_9HYPH|nr:phosphoenolpyruvate hydrolase family protein [Sinorhizobium garamanticum]WEX91684.1 phosphoenolpyruvate hydrolase family protein [Sinorhizobium garamanticum]